MTVKTVGIDVAKSVFHLVGLNRAGKIVLRRRLSRTQLLRLTAQLKPCLIGMEPCCGAHHLGRRFVEQGHEARLIPAQFVRPFVKSNKNDYNDAEAIAEAVGRPRMRFAPLKTVEQLDLQALHRVRDRLVGRRTGVINQLRAFLLERGLAVRQGRLHLQRRMPELLEDAEVMLSARMRALLDSLWQEWRQLEAEIAVLTQQIRQVAHGSPDCQRLMQIPGIGPLIATALVAAIGSGHGFRCGRDLGAWLGLVPRQHTTGGKQKLLGISKRGNSYLRRLLLHGARAARLHAHREQHLFGAWLSRLEQRVHANVAVTALANKLARIAWAVLYHKQDYRQKAPASIAAAAGGLPSPCSG
jgi:transposase